MEPLATPNEVAELLAGRRRFVVLEGEALDLLARLPSASVGAVVTDPPYSSGGFTRSDRNIDPASKYSKAAERMPGFTGDSRDQRSFAYWCALWLGEALRASTPGAPVVQFSDWRQLPSTTDALQAGGWVWRGIFVWSKGALVRPMMGRFRASCEFAAWGTNGPSPDLEAVGCLPGDIYCPPVPQGDERLHLTQKPEKVMETVCAIAPPGAIVLDPFCGSGSTGVAALRLGRRFIGFEKDADYARTARERLEATVEGQSLKARRAGQTTLGLEPPDP